MAFGGDVGARHHLEETLGDRILDLAIEQFLAIDESPRMLVVVCPDAFIIFDRRDLAGAALAEGEDGVGGLGAVFPPHAVDVVQQLAVQHHLLGIHRDGLQPEMLHQLAQRVRPRHRVVIEFGDAGFVHRRRAVERERHDLAADAVGGFEDGDAAEAPPVFS